MSVLTDRERVRRNQSNDSRFVSKSVCETPARETAAVRATSAWHARSDSPLRGNDDCSDSVVLAERSAARRSRLVAEAPRVAGFTWQPLKQRFVRSGGKCRFDPATQEAYSYGWWRFVERVGPYLVFNSYAYSVTTRKHQWATRELLSELGLSIDFEIEAPRGLQSLESASHLYLRRLAELEASIAKKGSRRAKNAERAAEIARLRDRLAWVGMLQRHRDAACEVSA